MLELLIAGGTVVDGTGRGGFRADVGISDGHIVAIRDLSGAGARHRIDAAGMTVSPGFIDTHTHSEGDLLTDPQHAYGILQGITTELLGIDGMSYSPLSPENYRAYRRWLGGLLGHPPEDLDMSTVTAFRGHYDRRVAVNTGYLVPAATVRLEAVGFRDVPLSGESMTAARRLVAEGIGQGAVGLSMGGAYYPGPWYTTEELVELCEVVADAGAVFMCEPRRANPARAFSGGGVEEAIEIARRSGAKLHLAHFRTSAESAGRVDDLMEPVDRAKAQGVDVTLDIYPYPTGASIPVSFLPAWAQEGGPDEIVERLRDAALRDRIVEHIEGGSEMPAMLEEGVLTFVRGAPDLEGLTFGDVAALRGQSPARAICDLLVETDLAVGWLIAPPRSTALWRQVSRDCMALLARDDYMVCSDHTPAGSMPHPRCYGAFPRILGRLRRQFGGLTLEQVVHRMTARPAGRFGLVDRGVIREGAYADLVVFDPEQVIDTATYDDPRQHPVGISHVVVNGQLAVEGGRPTGVLAGRAVP